MIYGCKDHLRSDLLTKVLEHCIVDCDVAQNAIVSDGVLLEKLFDCCRAYICDRIHLDQLCEVLHDHNSEGVVSLFLY
jgi:hypothetical protein